jgi:O-antigen ligase
VLLTLAALLTALPVWPFLAPRTDLSGRATELERASTLERGLLIGYSLDAFRAQPLTGVGAGSFVQWAARAIPERYPFEPVHNVPLLILAETGLLGGAVVALGAGAWLWRVWRRRAVMPPAEAVWSATLLGLFVSMLFDHLWWSQAPARLLFVLVLALWANASHSPGTHRPPGTP